MDSKDQPQLSGVKIEIDVAVETPEAWSIEGDGDGKFLHGQSAIVS